MWNYLYYLMYLDKKPDNEYDGNELYVWRTYTEGSTLWIPQNITIFLSKEFE